jgi:hypothetical protein
MKTMSRQIARIRFVRGEKLPPGARCVTRISRWGNKYKLIEHGGEYTREQSIALFRADVEAMTPEYRQQWLAPLRTATALACCAPGLLCHADVLIEFLQNEEEQS